jgi:hypothetical protein
VHPHDQGDQPMICLRAHAIVVVLHHLSSPAFSFSSGIRLLP